MKQVHYAMVAIVAIHATPAAAQSVFDGTWKIDMASARLPSKPSVSMLESGTFRCESCTPAYTVKADGAFHDVPNTPDFDAVAVTVIDPRTVKMEFRKGGRLVDTETDTASADGKTLTYTDIDSSATSGKTVIGTGVQTRVGPAPAGAHATSGSWRTTRIDTTGGTATFHSDGTRLEVQLPSGIHYSPAFGGGYVPVQGSVSEATVAVTRNGPRSFVARYRQNGKDVSTLTVTVAPDGRSETLLSRNLVNGTSTSSIAYKQ